MAEYLRTCARMLPVGKTPYREQTHSVRRQLTERGVLSHPYPSAPVVLIDPLADFLGRASAELLRRATFLAGGGWWPLLASCWTTRTSGTKREALSRIAIVKAFRALDRRLLSACGGSPTAGSDVLRAVCLPPDHLPLSVKFDTVAAWPECNQKHLYFLTSVKFYLAITTP